MSKLKTKLKDLRFYADHWAPNGTSTLIVTDDLGTVVFVVNEFLFGPTLDTHACGHMFYDVFYCDGEGVWSIPDTEIEDNPCLCEDQVFPMELNTVLEYIAVSPVHTKYGRIKELLTATKGA